MSSAPRRLHPHDVPSVLHFLGLSLASHVLSLTPNPSHPLALTSAKPSPMRLSRTRRLGAYLLRESRPLTHWHRGSTLLRYPLPAVPVPKVVACPGARPPPCLSVLGISPSLGMGAPSPLHRELPPALCPGPAPAHRTCYLRIPPGKPPQPHTLRQATPPSWPARLSPSSLPPKAEAWDCSSHPLPPAPHLPAPRETGLSTLPKEMLLPLTQTLR